MRQVDIWIEGETSGVYDKIELFQDEEIIINSSIQNVQDISKVFTDYSQTFTIPASAENNRIFKHYYENSIDTTINPNYRRNAYIEIDLSPFKSGKIAIEKANIVNDKVESYTITFYGLVINLKDKFEKFKLVDLDFSDLNITATLTNYENYIDTTLDNDLAFPLISTKKDRVWNYGQANSNDISINSGAIDLLELNPAIRAKTILDKIATKCDITFTGAFLSDKKFTKSFLWFQNDKEKLQTTTSNELDIISYTINVNGTTTTISNDSNPNVKVTGTTDNFINISKIAGQDSFPTKLIVNLDTIGTTVVYVDIYVNGKFQQTFTGNSNTDIVVLNTQNKNLQSFPNKYIIKIRTQDAITGTPKVTAITPSAFGQVTTWKFSCSSMTFTAPVININDFIPDLSFEDYVTSIIKTFNLTVVPKSETEFELIPLDDYYSKGKIYDITPYVDIDNITISRIPLSKKNEFKHEKTNNFLNEQYSKTSSQSREFGDYIYYDSNLEDGEFKIETKFGDISTAKIDTDMYVGYALDKAYNPQLQAPLLLYVDNRITKSFKITNGVTYRTLTGYRPFIQETTIDGTRYSIHFSNELSVKDGANLTNNLFSQYYASYFFGLTNPKNRLTNVTTTFPLSLLTKIKLYDRLVIRDKRYIINDIKQNLTSSEVELNLLHDFRQVMNPTLPNALQEGGQMSFIMVAPEGGNAQMTYEISLDTEDGVGYETENDLLLLTEYSQVVTGGDQVVTITYPPIQETTYLIDSSGNEIITNDGLNIASTEVTGNYFTIDFTLFFEDGSEYTQPYNVFYE